MQKPFLICAALSAFVTQLAAQPLKFDFGSGEAPAGWTTVTPAASYSIERGFGFEPDSKVEAVDRGGDAVGGDFVTAAQPFYFSVALPEGNYRVTATLGDPAGETETTIKAELRRLMAEGVTTKKGEAATRTFIVNVRRPEIAGGGEVRLKGREKKEEAFAWDEKLTLEFNGSRPAIAALEIERVDDLPTVFLIGDSTVADQPREPYASWGQMLTRFFAPTVAIANHSESGESLASAVAERRLEKVLSVIRPGDYVFVQFGHNDMKKDDVMTYGTNLVKFTAALTEKKASVVLVTQMHRHTFDRDGRVTNSHKDYPDVVRAVARAASLPLIDLHAMSRIFYEALGEKGSLQAFKPGDGTHHSPYGAYELAKCVVEGIRHAKLPLEKHLLADLPRFDPGKPDAFAAFAVPPSPTPAAAKPDGS